MDSFSNSLSEEWPSQCLPSIISPMAHTASDPAHETQTVQLKGPDALKQCEEPEWRRKVLKGELETKEGLFAPTGLEKLFDPPPDVSYMPSSPPVHFPPRCRSQGDNSHVSSNERFSPICVTPYVTAKGKFGFSTKSPWVPSEPSSSIVFPSNLTMGTDVPLRLKPRSPTTVQDNEVDESPQTDYPEECKMSDELPLPERRAVEHHERSDASRSDSFARKVSRKSSIQTADYFAEAERVMAAIRARGREQDRERNQRREIQSQRPASDDGMGTGRAHVSNNWRDGQTTPDISTRSRPRSSDGTPGRERFQENWRDGPATLDTSELKQYRNASERFDARKRRMSHQNSGPLEIKKTRATLPKAASNNPLSVRKTIRPEALSHLVPDRVANLVFDREAKKWISAKAYDKLRGLANGVPTSDESEEDPFKNIPDLPVDEASAAQKTVAPPKADSIEQEIEPDDDGTVDQNSQAEQRYRLENGLEPIPEESLGSLAEHKSEHRLDHKIDPKLSTVDEVPTVASIETVSVEHEIQAHEGRSEIASPQARNITISFTSPVVSRFREYTAESPSQSINETACGHSSRATSPSRAARQTSLTPSHRSFELRATDQAELSVCSGPAGNGSICLKSLPEIGEEESEGTLALSAITLRGYRHRRTSHTPPRCSLAEEKIVSALTDVKPFDPHWDRLHDVDLSGKDLPSLYKLEKYCPELVELDVSNNQISQLIGAPSGIRYLNAANNMLSSITSWGHLMNLQFLDVSNNRLESLDSFKSLVHLREVKADHNRIKNLDAVAEMEGLTKLSLVGNELENVEVEETRLTRLICLDLRHNKIRYVRNLHRLTALEELNLDDNEIYSVEMDDTKPLSKLRSLKLNRNRLESIDISGMPHLRHLQLDRNQVSSIKGLPSAHHLKSLSLREQDQPLFGPKCHLVFDDFYELRELYLSGNVIQTPLSPRRQFLNMQHLELANVGLTALPRKFGSRFRNLRTLNLNYNAISEVEELRGLIRLKSLMLAGNRLSRLRKTAAVLKKVGGYLEVLDLRDNPVTIGFYAATPAPEGATASCPSPSGEEEKRGASPFAKPATPAAADAAYRRRLDEDTRLRRRVYELLMVAAAASKLQTLDGVELDRPAVKQEDADWRRLVEMGILRNKTSV